jgi:alpha-tubulin suppressor-like RCC1 family protein
MPTTNFKFNSTDLDALFEPIGASSKRADVSYRVGGTDISNYYYSVSNGGTAFGTTNFRAGDVDIGTMFAALGSVTTEKFLYTWGINTLGQLGGNFSEIKSWTSVAAGGSHTVAIRNDGLLFAWGSGFSGQLGDGTNQFRPSPVQIGSSSWTQVSAGQSHTAAIRSDGLLFTWGGGSSGRLGLGATGGVGNRSSPTQVGTSSWTQVSTGGTHTVAITSVGGLFAWGAGSSGRLGVGNTTTRSIPLQIGTSSWTQVSAGQTHTAAIRSDNRLFTWGAGSSGRLGVGIGGTGTISRSSPTQVGTSSWTQVSAGGSHTAAIRSDGLLFTWGSAATGRLGNGTTTVNRSSPVQIGSDLWNSVSAADAHSAAIRNDGALFTWGVGTSGRLGDGSTLPRSVPTQVGTSSWTQVSAGTTHTAGILNNNLLYSWGSDASGQLGLGTIGGIQISPMVLQSTESTSSPGQIGSSSWSMVSAGRYGTGAIRSDGILFMWGLNNFGQVGNGSTAYIVNSPSQIGASSWIMVSVGDHHTAAIRSDTALFIWGSGYNGRLGNNASSGRRSSPIQVGTSISWLSVSAGRSHTVGVQRLNTYLPDGVGSLYAWGGNQYGQLGVGAGDTINRSNPAQVTSLTYTVVSAGEFHNAAIAVNFAYRDLYTWGRGGVGKLGNGSTINRSTPVFIPLPNDFSVSKWSMVSAGRYATAAIDYRNLLYTWGFNPGTLGLNDSIVRSLPTQVGSSSWTSVSSGDRWTAAIRSDGALFTWGLGSYGRLGNESTLARSSPIQIGSATNWKEVSAGGSHGVALKS